MNEDELIAGWPTEAVQEVSRTMKFSMEECVGFNCLPKQCLVKHAKLDFAASSSAIHQADVSSANRKVPPLSSSCLFPSLLPSLFSPILLSLESFHRKASLSFRLLRKKADSD